MFSNLDLRPSHKNAFPRFLGAIVVASLVIPTAPRASDDYYSRERLSDPGLVGGQFVSVQVGDVRFRFPRQYLYSHVEHEQPQRSLLLLALGPELAARTRDSENISWMTHPQRIEKFGYDPFITFLIQDASNFHPFRRIVELRTSDRSVYPDGISSDGLSRYGKHAKTYPSFSEIWIEEQEGLPTTLIQCRPNAPAPRCELVFRHLSLQIHANYPMHDGGIQDWREFRRTLIAKLNSFVVN